MKTHRRKNAPSRAVTSARLKDGAIAEMIFRAEDSTTTFLCDDGAGCSAKTEIEVGGELLRPLSASNNLLTHRVVLFPSEASDFASEQDLVDELRDFIHRYVDVSQVFEQISAYYVLLSWIHDAFNELPYLRVKGDYGTGKSRFLLTVGSLCYKPIFASGASTVSPIFRILDSLGGTLIVDEADFRASDEKADIIKILNNGNARGFPVLRSEAAPTKEYNPRAFNVFGPKIVATRDLFEDRALESRCITEEMSGAPPREGIPLNLPESFHDEALLLRNKLLSFRFRNLRQDRCLESFYDKGVEARVNQVVAPLMATMNDEGARSALRALARQHSGTLATDRQLTVESQVLEVVFHLRQGHQPLSLKAITTEFSTRFADQYERAVTPRWIGSLLRRRLSIRPVRREGTFLIPRDEYPRLDLLFAKFGFGDIGGRSVTSPTADSNARDGTPSQRHGEDIA